MTLISWFSKDSNIQYMIVNILSKNMHIIEYIVSHLILFKN